MTVDLPDISKIFIDVLPVAAANGITSTSSHGGTRSTGPLVLDVSPRQLNINYIMT